MGAASGRGITMRAVLIAFLYWASFAIQGSSAQIEPTPVVSVAPTESPTSSTDVPPLEPPSANAPAGANTRLEGGAFVEALLLDALVARTEERLQKRQDY